MRNFENKDTIRQMFSGTVFATFKDTTEYEGYKDFYPDTFFKRLSKLFQYYFCGCCLHKDKLASLKKSLDLVVEEAPEPEDVIWENLQITYYDRLCRKFVVLFIVILILGLSFGTLLAISVWQNNIDKELNDCENKDIPKTECENKNETKKYLISVLFALSTSIFNFIIQKLLLGLTHYEKNISHTNFNLAFSQKLLLFTWLNSGPLVVITNHLSYRWNGATGSSEQDNLNKNVFLIFIINSICDPFLYIINPFYWINQCRRNSIINSLQENPNYLIGKTQAEVNQ